MINGNIDFSVWHIDAIKKYFDTMNLDDLSELGSAKATLNNEANKQGKYWSEKFRPLELQLAEAAEKNDMATVSRLSGEIKPLREKYEECAMIAIKRHLEACCIWIEMNQRLGYTEDIYTSEQLANFPVRTWELVKEKQMKYGFYTYPELVDENKAPEGVRFRG